MVPRASSERPVLIVPTRACGNDRITGFIPGVPWAVLDLPVSGVLDMLILPYTI